MHADFRKPAGSVWALRRHSPEVAQFLNLIMFTPEALAPPDRFALQPRTIKFTTGNYVAGDGISEKTKVDW
jgi:hypothetical protein